MDCKHTYKVEKVEDIPKVDFYTTRKGNLSKRWRHLKCQKCGHIKSEPVED